MQHKSEQRFSADEISAKHCAFPHKLEAKYKHNYFRDI